MSKSIPQRSSADLCATPFIVPTTGLRRMRRVIKMKSPFQQADQSNENQSSFGLFGCCQSCCICGSGGQTTEVSCGNCRRSGEPILCPGRAWSGSESKGNQPGRQVHRII